MYIRPVHAELDVPTLHEFIRLYPLGLFTTAIPHSKHATLQTTHIPFVLDDDGVLRAHIARANPQAKAIIDAADLDEVLILFNAPVHSYVTPKFYVETKPTNGKVVPTWDYAAVQVYGKIKVYHQNNEKTGQFLQQQIVDLTKQQEGGLKGGKPWKVEDAPKNYVDLLKKAIIGLEITIDRVEGRFKLSQESGEGDRQGVIDGFRSLGTQQGEEMARMIERRGVA